MVLSIKALIGALIGIVVGLALFPTVKTQVDAVNVTGVSGGTLIGLIPMLYIIIIFAGAVGYVYVSSR
jgi:ACR3 family arsenite efflux pump ArsB